MIYYAILYYNILYRRARGTPLRFFLAAGPIHSKRELVSAWSSTGSCNALRAGSTPSEMRGWWNTVELVLFEISNSIKPYPSVFHAYTSKLRPVIGFSSKLIPMRFPTVFRQPPMKERVARARSAAQPSPAEVQRSA